MANDQRKQQENLGHDTHDPVHLPATTQVHCPIVPLPDDPLPPIPYSTPVVPNNFTIMSLKSPLIDITNFAIPQNPPMQISLPKSHLGRQTPWWEMSLVKPTHQPDPISSIPNRTILTQLILFPLDTAPNFTTQQLNSYLSTNTLDI